MERISASAKFLEEHGELLKTREQWLKTLPLLPQDANQAEWIRNKARQLELAAAAAPPPSGKYKWARRLGPAAPIAILLAKSKAFLLLFKLKSLFSLWIFMAFYWRVYGARFGIGFAVLILAHEMGHYADIKLRELPADMPVFLPGLGAYVRWQGLGVSQETRAAISLAGPLAGWLGAARLGKIEGGFTDIQAGRDMGLRKASSIKHGGKRLTEILEAHARFFGGKDGGARADLTEADLSNADLSGVNLSGAILRRAKLVGADLRKAKLPGADLSGADLRKADLRNTDMTEAALAGADLGSAQASGVEFFRCDLSNANFQGALLRNANFRSAHVNGAKFAGADMGVAILRETDLTGADLGGVDLTTTLMPKNDKAAQAK